MATDSVPREQVIDLIDLIVGDLLKLDWRIGGWGRVLEINRLADGSANVRLDVRGVSRIATLSGQVRVMR